MSHDLLLSILKPGDKILWIVGMPGPDTDDMEVLEVEDGKVRIRYKTWGQGPSRETWISPSQIVWMKGTEFSARYHEAVKQASETGRPQQHDAASSQT